MSNERFQLQYPLDLESIATLKPAIERLAQERREIQAIIIPSGATSFEVRGEVMVVTAAAGVTIATIVDSMYDGFELTLIFTDTNVTITDDATGAKNTINLSGAFTSTANDVMKLIYRNLSWYEVGRSVN